MEGTNTSRVCTDAEKEFTWNDVKEDPFNPKMKAYMRMQELRKETAKYDISEIQRDKALDEKFGRLDNEKNDQVINENG